MTLDEIMDMIAQVGSDDMFGGFHLATWTWNERKVNGRTAKEVEAMIKANAPRYASRGSAASQSKMLKVVGKYTYTQLVAELDKRKIGQDWTNAVKLAYGDFDAKAPKATKAPKSWADTIAAKAVRDNVTEADLDAAIEALLGLKAAAFKS
jgi:hypothetical protein